MQDPSRCTFMCMYKLNLYVGEKYYVGTEDIVQIALYTSHPSKVRVGYSCSSEEL